MTCIKTGAHVHVQEYDCWVVCDIHQIGEIWVLRTCPSSYKPERDVSHGEVHSIGDWFDRDKHYGTLVSPSMTYHGYNGVPIA